MNLIDIIGAVIGLFYIVSEYRADRWFWPLSILMSVFYAIICFTNGVYANGAIYCYNFAMSVYGLLVWRGVLQSKDGGERPITSCPARNWLWIVPATVVLSLLLIPLLHALGESTYTLTNGTVVDLSVLDGIAAALSIISMVMVAQKWWQQWFVCMAIEPLMIAIYLLTGNYASALLYAVFLVFCIFGVIKWKKESIS